MHVRQKDQLLSVVQHEEKKIRLKRWLAVSDGNDLWTTQCSAGPQKAAPRRKWYSRGPRASRLFFLLDCFCCLTSVSSVKVNFFLFTLWPDQILGQQTKRRAAVVFSLDDETLVPLTAAVSYRSTNKLFIYQSLIAGRPHHLPPNCILLFVCFQILDRAGTDHAAAAADGQMGGTDGIGLH